MRLESSAGMQFYAEMAKKISMIDFGADKERVQLQFLQHLELRDEVPVSPNRMRLAMTCFILGLMLAIGVPFLIEFLDHTVNDVEEVEQVYKIRGWELFRELMNERLQVILLSVSMELVIDILLKISES
jgi:hypothetical protein